jgi:hypothetical protein
MNTRTVVPALALALALAGFLAACADVPTGAVAPDATLRHAINLTTAVTVTGEYLRQEGGDVVWVNTHPRAGTPAGGTCGTAQDIDTNGPVWYNRSGNPTTASWCVERITEEVTCTFETGATYETDAGDRGDQRLEFEDHTIESPLYIAAFGDFATRAEGTLEFAATCTDGTMESGELDVSEFSWDGGNRFIDDNSLYEGDDLFVTVAGALYLLLGMSW